MRSIRADLHYHGPEKRLGTPKWNPRELAKIASGKLEVLAVTQYGNDDKRFEELKKAGVRDIRLKRIWATDNEIYVPEYGVLLVKTQEIPTASGSKLEGHILVLGNKKPIEEGNLDYVLNRAAEQGAAAGIAHGLCGPSRHFLGAFYANPEDKMMKYFAERKIHFVEYNGMMASKGFLSFIYSLAQKNKAMVDFAEAHGLKVIANSDGNSEDTTAGAKTIFEGDFSDPKQYLQEICEALRSPINKIKPSPVPGPAFCADRHAFQVAKYRTLRKLFGINSATDI